MELSGFQNDKTAFSPNARACSLTTPEQTVFRLVMLEGAQRPKHLRVTGRPHRTDCFAIHLRAQSMWYNVFTSVVPLFPERMVLLSDELSGFSLVLDSLDFSAKLPYEIIPDHWFRKAKPKEIDRIKKELSIHNNAPYYYEYANVSGTDSAEVRPLPPDEWKYYVISFSSSNDKLATIEYATNLLKDDISLGYTFFNVDGLPGGVGFSPAYISTFFIDHFMPVKKVSRAY